MFGAPCDLADASTSSYAQRDSAMIWVAYPDGGRRPHFDTLGKAD